MGKGLTVFSGLLSVVLLLGVSYGVYNVYSNLDSISTGDDPLGASDSSTTDGTSMGASFRNVQVSNTSDLHSGNLVNITADNYTDYSTTSIELCKVSENKVESYSAWDESIEISTNVITEINSMITEFNQSTDNTETMINTGYISSEDLTDYSQCDHVTGLSFDMGAYDGSNFKSYTGAGDFSWIADRADKYGFIQRYPSSKVDITGIDEPSHFRYVGLPHSAYMKENDLCLEEYIEEVKSYTYDNPIEYTTFNGRTYDIYYVVAENGDTTNIPVLMDMEYSISGDNEEGFIVAVKVGG
jgi:D-alanyl-D-alanine carboxypeptidase